MMLTIKSQPLLYKVLFFGCVCSIIMYGYYMFRIIYSRGVRPLVEVLSTAICVDLLRFIGISISAGKNLFVCHLLISSFSGHPVLDQQCTHVVLVSIFVHYIASMFTFVL